MIFDLAHIIPISIYPIPPILPLVLDGHLLHMQTIRCQVYHQAGLSVNNQQRLMGYPAIKCAPLLRATHQFLLVVDAKTHPRLKRQKN